MMGSGNTLMKHRLSATRSARNARMKRLLCKREAKRTDILSEPKARFIRRSLASFFMHRRCASLKKALRTKCFFLAPPTGIEPITSP